MLSQVKPVGSPTSEGGVAVGVDVADRVAEGFGVEEVVELSVC